MPARYVELIDRFIRAATDLDINATRLVLDEMFAIGSFESIVDDLVMPALVELGDAWSTGRIDVAAEHAASSAVYRRLATLYDAAAISGETQVVVGLPPGARHELGAFAFAVAVRRRGAGVLYLGADVPVSSWTRAVDERRARVAAIAVVQEADRPAALEVVRALRLSRVTPIIALGGRYADVGAGNDTAVVRLPERIVDAAETAARLARSPRPRIAREGASR
jgi:methanogenic corrinoid protein MtbC1